MLMITIEISLERSISWKLKPTNFVRKALPIQSIIKTVLTIARIKSAILLKLSLYSGKRILRRIITSRITNQFKMEKKSETLQLIMEIKNGRSFPNELLKIKSVTKLSAMIPMITNHLSSKPKYLILLSLLTNFIF